jgi:hypothetical protein
VTVTGSSNKRVSVAALIAVKPGQQPRLIYRVHRARRRRRDQRKGFTETSYARLLDSAHQQLDGPLVLVWDTLKCAARRCCSGWRWKTVHRLPSQRWGEAGGSLIRGSPGRVGAASTKSRWPGTAGWAGRGERDGKVYARNRCRYAS